MEENSATNSGRYLLDGDAFLLNELETSISHAHHVYNVLMKRQKLNKVSGSAASLDEVILRSPAKGTSCDETSDESISTNQNSTKADISGYDMSKEHVKWIQTHYIELTEKMDVDNGLLSELYANDIISSVEKQSIQSQPDSYNKIQKLLSLIVMKSTENYQQFVEALSRTGQQHLVTLLNSRSKCLGEDVKSSHFTNSSTKQNLSVSQCNRRPRLDRGPPPPTLPKPTLAESCHPFTTTSDSYSFNSAIKPLASSFFQGRQTHIPQNHLQKNPKIQKKTMDLNTDKLLYKLDIRLNSLIYTKVVLRLRQLHLILPDNLAVKLKEKNELILAQDRQERIFVEGTLHFVSTEHELSIKTRKLKYLQKLNQELDTDKRQLERLMKSDERIREQEQLKAELKTLLKDKQEMRNDLSQRNKEIEQLKITLNHTRDDNEKLKVDTEIMRRENLPLLNDLIQASNEREMVKKVEASHLETDMLEDEQRNSLRKKKERVYHMTREVEIKQKPINELTAANTGFNEVEKNMGKIEYAFQMPLGVPPGLQSKQITNTLRAEPAMTEQNSDVLMKENQTLDEEINDRKEKCKTVKEKYRNDAIEPIRSSLFLSKPTVVRVIPGSDKGRVYGIAVLGSQLFTAREGVTSVEVYDANNMSTTPRLLKISDKTLNRPRLAACSHYNCLYVRHWSGPTTESVMYRVELSNSSVSEFPLRTHFFAALSITHNHTVLVTLYQVQKYTTDCKLMREITLDISIDRPRHCIQLSDGNFVISHSGYKQHRVCIVDDSGRIIKSYGRSPGSDVDQLNEPCQLSVDKYDHVFVADYGNNRIQLLSPALTLHGTVQIPGHTLDRPVALHFDNINHRLYVSRGSDVLVVELNNAEKYGIQSVV